MKINRSLEAQNESLSNHYMDVMKHSEDFAKRSGAHVGTDWSNTSKYDIRVLIHPGEKVWDYMNEARQRFPGFTFVPTTDPKEKPMHYDIVSVMD